MIFDLRGKADTNTQSCKHADDELLYVKTCSNTSKKNIEINRKIEKKKKLHKFLTFLKGSKLDRILYCRKSCIIWCGKKSSTVKLCYFSTDVETGRCRMNRGSLTLFSLHWAFRAEQPDSGQTDASRWKWTTGAGQHSAIVSGAPPPPPTKEEGGLCGGASPDHFAPATTGSIINSQCCSSAWSVCEDLCNADNPVGSYVSGKIN